MKTFILSFLGGLAALVFFFLLVPLAIVMTIMPDNEPEPVKDAVISLDLREAWPDQPPADEVGAFFADTAFIDILLRLNAASRDDNVKGVFIRAAEFNIGSTRAEELRAAILRLQEKGKFVIAHSQGFLSSGPGAYRAIAPADEIWIQPGSEFEVPGVTFETLFMGEAFEKLNVDVEIEQFLEYKNAPDVYKQTGYTPAHAEAMTTIAETVWSRSVADIAADRDLDLNTLRGVLEQSPYRAEQTVGLGLTDKLGWPEEAMFAAVARAKGVDAADITYEDAWETMIDVSRYQPSSGSDRTEGVIAIVGGEGAIVTGNGGGGDFFSVGTPVFASDTIAHNLRILAEDDDIDAVVFRVDSGGGSAIASDQIWRAVQYLQESGKKVVVSMGSMAASGGYYVAAGADAIVANPSTLTGSIGVYGGKFAIADGLRMIGVNPDEVGVGGAYASAYSTEELTPEQRQKLVAGLEATYERFTGLVAEGRNIPIERVQEIARGRVWTGEDARELGLVDETGDLITAINKAKELAGIDPDDLVRLRIDRPETSPLRVLRGLMGVSATNASPGVAARALVGVLGNHRTAALINQLTAASQRGAQLSAPVYIER